MSEKILVPVLGESITEATVTKWLKKKGDNVVADEAVVELETDKVNVEVPAPSNGVLERISVQEGETVNVGALLGMINGSAKEVSKNVKDSKEISDILKSFKKNKSNKDLRRTGLVTLFTGIGLAALGEFGLSLDILFGVGLLVMFIGLGQMIAGYVYPNQPDEITDVVENYEKK